MTEAIEVVHDSEDPVRYGGELLLIAVRNMHIYPYVRHRKTGNAIYVFGEDDEKMSQMSISYLHSIGRYTHIYTVDSELHKVYEMISRFTLINNIATAPKLLRNMIYTNPQNILNEAKTIKTAISMQIKKMKDTSLHINPVISRWSRRKMKLRWRLRNIRLDSQLQAIVKYIYIDIPREESISDGDVAGIDIHRDRIVIHTPEEIYRFSESILDAILKMVNREWREADIEI